MATLAEVRGMVTTRLAEESGVFWTIAARNMAINEAQRFIATVTKGVEVTLPAVGREADFPSYALAGIRNSYGVYNDIRFPAITIDEANMIDPRWQRYNAPPRWMVVDERGHKAYIAPRPSPAVEWEAKLRVIPPSTTIESDQLFLGDVGMNKFLSPLVNLACAYLLLQERFDGDAERFYQFAIQDLLQLGVDLPTVPPLMARATGGQ